MYVRNGESFFLDPVLFRSVPASVFHPIIISSYHHTIISSYHHIMVASCQHIIISSSSKKNCKSVLGQKSTKKSKIVFEPLHQGTERLDLLGKWGHFSWRICCLRSKIRSSSKTSDFWFDASFLVRKFHQKKFWGVEKSNVGNRLKRVLAKFRADRSHPRGVNGRSKTPGRILLALGGLGYGILVKRRILV